MLETDNSSLPETLYQAVREAILDGRFAPGAELRQEVLARQYGVSRVPLREALSRLQADGLIELRPRRGFAVAELDVVEIIELFELRMVVEQHALEVAARMRSEADLREIEALLVQMEEIEAHTPGNFPEWLDLNRRFHHRLVACAGRERLAATVSNLRDATEPYVRLEAHATGHVEDASSEHRQLYDAVRERNATLAGEVAREHALGTMKRLVEWLRLRKQVGKRGKSAA
ncbi:MAG TPA: GntR family transcriptional regulator [Novosphingobium sp.]|nr:GntR family transcriptional regulator [Novosphingobium sp.]